MTVLQRAARTAVDNLYHRGNLHFIRHNPRLTLQIKQLRAATHTITGVLADSGIKIDVDIIAGIDAVAGLLKLLIHHSASSCIAWLSIALKQDYSPLQHNFNA